MIVGIGTDLVDIRRIERLLIRHAQRFKARILHPAEAVSAEVDARFLAKRFAAKEAVAKALGTGIRSPVTWHHIRIEHTELGQPVVRTESALKAWLAEKGWRIHLSISDEKTHAMAVAIIESDFSCGK